jgi:hypothetical protein
LQTAPPKSAAAAVTRELNSAASAVPVRQFAAASRTRFGGSGTRNPRERMPRRGRLRDRRRQPVRPAVPSRKETKFQRLGGDVPPPDFEARIYEKIAEKRTFAIKYCTENNITF